MTSAPRLHPAAAAEPLSCAYGYDADDLLAWTATSQRTCQRFWRIDELANELRTQAGTRSEVTWLRALGQPITEQIAGAGARVTLLANTVSGSVVLEADAGVRGIAFAPQGHRSVHGGEQEEPVLPAFNGEMLDDNAGAYPLGAGHHRPYSPTLGMFLAPDDASPFEGGGINALSYCAGDPVNRVDPDGHFWKWVLAGVSIVMGVAAVAASFGAASLAVGAVVSGGIAALTKSGAAAIAVTTLGTAALAAEVGAASAWLASDEKTAQVLGWIGFGLGMAAGAPAIAKAAGKGAAKLSRFTRRIATTRSQGISSKGSGAAGRHMAAPPLRVGASVNIGKAQLAVDRHIHVLQAHGAYAATATDRIVDGGTLARQIDAAASNGPPIQQLELQVCFSGSGGRYFSQAQTVADRLRVRTTGFKGVMEAGDPFQRGRVMGHRVHFEPQTGFPRMRTSVLNHTLH